MPADPSGAVTLALDDLLTDASPDLRALVDSVPPALRDQLDAAARHGRNALTGLGEVSGVRPLDVPPWVRLAALETWVRWAMGTGSTCNHAPVVVRPEPVVAAAWRPGLVACCRCGHLLVLHSGSDADRTCDGCGRVTGGVEVGDGIRPTALQVGPMTYLLGVCGRCEW